MQKKLKIVWLCGFTSDHIQQQIKPYRKVGQIALWISNLIEIFEKNELFELHIISPHQYIPGYRYFYEKKIHYHFVNQGIPFLGCKWPSFFPVDVWTDYYKIKRDVRKIIDRIKPDLIHMHGAENTYHSAAIKQFKDLYPVVISIQGFVSKSRSVGLRIRRRKEREIEIIKTFRHYGYRTETMGMDIKKLNKDAVLHYLRYPIKHLKSIITEKKYDIVFFARVTKEKGIGDLIEAISMIKKSKPDISMCVIGRGKTQSWKQMASDLGVGENIHWVGFLMDKDDVHKFVSASRVCVLPTYHEIISGTIMESMFLGVPVVAYDVGSIHEINRNAQVVTLVEKADIQGLADAVFKLLSNADLWQEKSMSGIARAEEMFTTDELQIRNNMVKAYDLVINDFNNPL